MARSFDGTNDVINHGSNGSIDDFVVQSVLAWVQRAVTNANHEVLTKHTSTSGWEFRINSAAGGQQLLFQHQWSTTNGAWTGSATIDTAMHQVAVSYDSGSTANDPAFYLDNAVDATIDILTPAGTLSLDNAYNLLVGESGSGAGDFNGLMQCVVYIDEVLTAEMVNRHYWWGTPKGGPSTLECWFPYWTDVLLNKGTATATGTATGTTVASLPRGQRPGFAAMGLGCGW